MSKEYLSYYSQNVFNRVVCWILKTHDPIIFDNWPGMPGNKLEFCYRCGLIIKKGIR